MWSNAQTQNLQNSAVSFDRLLRFNDMPVIYDSVQTNRTLQLERLSGYYFHQLINKYRLSKGLKTLYWDDRMWLAARNHNLYLWKLGDLTHDETKNGNFYSGIKPWDRMQFVMYDAYKMKIYGENCLYNFSYDNVNSLNENALSIAEQSFEQWKKSPGHNANMLNVEYSAHGTSFIVVDNGSRVYGCTNFGNLSDFQLNEISVDWDIQLRNTLPKPTSLNGESFAEYIWRPEDEYVKLLYLVKLYMPSMSRLSDKNMQVSASKHLTYMLKNKTTDAKEIKNNPEFYASTTLFRYIKAAGSEKIMFGLSHKLKEIYFSRNFPKKEIVNGTYLNSISSELNKLLPDKKYIENWGSAIKVTDFSEKAGEELFQCHINMVFVYNSSDK